MKLMLTQASIFEHLTCFGIGIQACFFHFANPNDDNSNLLPSLKWLF
jgi:hypothetical protein